VGAIAVHHTATTKGTWDGPAAVAAMPDHDEATYRYCYAWVDSSGDPAAKNSFSFPHHTSQGGPANLNGCRNALARLSSADIPSTDDAGVKAHIQAHLDDAAKVSADGGHPKENERTAAMPATIDEMISGIEAELDTQRRSRDSATAGIEAITEMAENAGRLNLTADEDTHVRSLVAARKDAKDKMKAIEVQLGNAQRVKAEEVETQRISREVKSTGVKKPAYDEVARVGAEERTYHPGNDRKGVQFMKDAVNMFLGDANAKDRVSRHMAEEKVERGQYLTRAVGTGAFTGLTVPQYLTEMYAPAVAAMRPFADACNHHDLPADGMTINISRITTPASVALQASQNSAVSSTDMADTLLTENVQTAAGQQIVSRAAIERGTGIEEVVMDDLYRRYATAVDSTLINQATTGLAAVANAITYTDSAPSGEALWPKLLQGAAASESALLGFAQPNAVIMHSRRWYWLSAQLTSQWPMFGQPGIGGVAAGENVAATYGHGARGVLPNGMVAIADNNIGTTLGAGTEDQLFVVSTQECHLWEDPSAPVFLRCEQPSAANLGVLLVLYGYFAYSFRRYPNANSVIGGSGMISPAF